MAPAPGPPQPPIGPPSAMMSIPGVSGTLLGSELVPLQPVFMCPRRPNLGTDGRAITLRANQFQITMPRGQLHHYDVTITPDKCPRKINR